MHKVTAPRKSKGTTSRQGLMGCCEITADHVTITELLNRVTFVFMIRRGSQKDLPTRLLEECFSTGALLAFGAGQFLLQRAVLLIVGHLASP